MTPSSPREYRVISADAHVLEPPDLWTRWLESKYLEQAPKLARDPDGGDAWQYRPDAPPEPLGGVAVAGTPMEKFRWTGVRYGHEIHPACHDGKERLAAMDLDGVDAEVLYPPNRAVTRFMEHADPGFQLAGLHAYNRWLHEDFCAADPTRLVGAYQLPNLGTEVAVSELRRARKLGFRTAVLGATPSGNDHIGPPDDPFWAAAQELEMPIAVHFRLAWQKDQPRMTSEVRPSRRSYAHFEVHTAHIQEVILQMIFSGVFDRFPLLSMVAVEVGVGWIPHFFEIVDDKYWRNRAHTGVSIRKLPSQYWKENWLATFVRDRIGVQCRHAVGLANMAWSTDFPHFPNSWPYSRQQIAEHFVGVPEREKQMILCTNAGRLYGLVE